VPDARRAAKPEASTCDTSAAGQPRSGGAQSAGERAPREVEAEIEEGPPRAFRQRAPAGAANPALRSPSQGEPCASSSCCDASAAPRQQQGSGESRSTGPAILPAGDPGSSSGDQAPAVVVLGRRRWGREWQVLVRRSADAEPQWLSANDVPADADMH
jgi:hypothetical protein